MTLPLLSLPRRTLFFYPEWPLPVYFLWSVCSAGRIRIKPGIGGRTMLFKDQTYIDEATLPTGHERWINGRCIDIRKSTVSRVYEEIFVNTLSVDPETYHGAAVRKSDENGTHDGFVVECPTRREDGYTYQKLIDNSIEDTRLTEVDRVIVVGDELPLCLVKYCPQSSRFSGFPSRVKVVTPREIFSQDELANITRFARAIGMDFGEVDVLRDRATGKIFIIDANPTALAHPVRMKFRHRLTVIRGVAASFSRQFFPETALTRAKLSPKRASTVQ